MSDVKLRHEALGCLVISGSLMSRHSVAAGVHALLFMAHADFYGNYSVEYC